MEPLYSQRNPSEAVFFDQPWFPKSQDGQEIAKPGMQIVYMEIFSSFTHIVIRH